MPSPSGVGLHPEGRGQGDHRQQDRDEQGERPAQRRHLGDEADERRAQHEAHVVEDVDAGDGDAAAEAVVLGRGGERQRDDGGGPEAEDGERERVPRQGTARGR